jgi:succinylglutamate desuccinylase
MLDFFNNVEGVEVLESGKSGPVVGFMAINHGDEPAGLAAHEDLRELHSHGKLLQGTVVLIRGNIKAHALGKADGKPNGKICVHDNMNRIWFDDENDLPTTVNIAESYEYDRVQLLKPVLRELDVFVDLHSTNNKSIPFSIRMVDDVRHRRLSRIMPVDFAARGFEKFIRGTANNWYDAQPGRERLSVAVECGYQGDPEGPEKASNSARVTLQELGMADFGISIVEVRRELVVVAQETVVSASDFDYERDFVNFELVQPGELIARDGSREYRVPDDMQDAAIIFPTKIESIRSRDIKEAFLLGKFEDV